MHFDVIDLGIVDFEKGLDLQRQVFSRVKNESGNSTLVICRNNPVITCGRQARKENILVSDNALKRAGIKTYTLERGGDVTYHGPGQLTAYPVFNLACLKKDIHFFLRQLEAIVIDFLNDFSLYGRRINGLTGVWAQDHKICSIGIAIKSWITFHGLSVNIKKNDLSNFSLIRPCGMDIRMTSLETLLDKEVDIGQTRDILVNKFIAKFRGYS